MICDAPVFINGVCWICQQSPEQHLTSIVAILTVRARRATEVIAAAVEADIARQRKAA